MTSPTLPVHDRLLEQLTWHWERQLHPRLAGMTTAEYLWEPVAGCGNVRPRGTGDAPVHGGSGDFTIDFPYPEPEPAPLTTIAWRIGHLVVGVLGARATTRTSADPRPTT